MLGLWQEWKRLCTLLHLTFLFWPVHQSNWPFLCHYTQRSVLSHQITSAERHSEEWRFVKLCFRTCNSLLWTSRKERKKKRSNSGSIRPWPCIAPLPFLYYISHTGSEAQPAVQSKLIYPEYWVPAKCLKCKMGIVGPQAGHGCWVFVWKKTQLVCMNVKSQPEHHETWLNVVEMNHVPSRLSTISTKHKQY